jgi:hypothetical protein
VRLEKPALIDFQELARAVKRNNMGLGGFLLRVQGTVEGGRVTLRPTGQVFTLSGPRPAEAGEAWRTFRVLRWDDPASTTLEVVEAASP